MRKVDPVKHEKKRREILAAVERCFIEKGYRGASIAQICGEARVSPGHLYHYFASKEDIVAAIAQAGVEGTAKALEEMLREADPFAALLQRVSQITRSGRIPATLLEMLSEAERNPAVAAIIREQSATIRGLFADILRKGQADGRVDASLDAGLAASLLISILVDGMKTLPIRDPEVDLGKAGEMLGLLVVRFLQGTVSAVEIDRRTEQASADPA